MDPGVTKSGILAHVMEKILVELMMDSSHNYIAQPPEKKTSHIYRQTLSSATSLALHQHHPNDGQHDW